MAPTASYHWPLNEILTSRREHNLVDSNRRWVSTTAAAFLNFALTYNRESTSTARNGAPWKGRIPGGAEPVFRHRTAIALYYLAIDEARQASSRAGSVHSNSSDWSLRSEDPTGLRDDHKSLFGSGLLQEMLSAPKDNVFVVKVFGYIPRALIAQQYRVSQELFQQDITRQSSVSIRLQGGPLEAAEGSDRKSHISRLRFSGIEPNADAGNSGFDLAVPCYPLLLVEEAFRLSIALMQHDVLRSTSSFAETLSTVNFQTPPGRLSTDLDSDVHLELCPLFFNLSHTVALRQTSPALDFSDIVLKQYARSINTFTLDQIQFSISVLRKLTP
ncbi:hypothetical protein JCM10212_003300 [Sporobolomyces blumeae]